MRMSVVVDAVVLDIGGGEDGSPEFLEVNDRFVR
jgi:hypothetical protein